MAITRDMITFVDDSDVMARIGKRAANHGTRQARTNHKEFFRGIAVFQEFTLRRAAQLGAANIFSVRGLFYNASQGTRDPYIK